MRCITCDLMTGVELSMTGSLSVKDIHTSDKRKAMVFEKLNDGLGFFASTLLPPRIPILHIELAGEMVYTFNRIYNFWKPRQPNRVGTRGQPCSAFDCIGLVRPQDYHYGI